MGSAEERSSGSSLVGPAGEEVAQLAAARQFPTVPHNGNKPQATSQSAASWSYLCGGAASRYQSQPAPHIQHGTTTFSYCPRIRRPGILQPKWAYCEISRDVGVGFRKEGEDDNPVCHLWLSEGQPGVDPGFGRTSSRRYSPSLLQLVQCGHLQLALLTRFPSHINLAQVDN